MGSNFNDNIDFSLKTKEPNNVFSIIDDIYNLGEINYNNIVVSIDSADNTATMNIETFKLNARYNEHLITIDNFLKKLPKAKINNIETYQEMFGYNSYNEALDSFLDYNSDEDTHCDLAFSFFKKGVLKKYL
ncbi:hypothetical protein [Photobacterium phosphoreum]|uniref:hypothetical protein n=1 Tax=Photobacterium phosphoreum TaxID=659 RepID=UPI00242E8E8C|nr:hypothetical protein [Photobacterium phosphoreum]